MIDFQLKVQNPSQGACGLAQNKQTEMWLQAIEERNQCTLAPRISTVEFVNNQILILVPKDLFFSDTQAN